MNKLWIGVLGTLGIAALAGAGVLYSGVVDVAADTPHSPLVHHLLEVARERSIARAVAATAADITPPADLDDGERIRRGAGNYAAMCANCHLTPGVANSEIRQGLYPTPPDLTQSTKEDAPRRFWIIKHGIKASGMPAWAKGGMEDGAIWDLVAFLGRLPALTPDQYRALVEASDGHAHGGLSGPASVPAANAPHDHSGHAH